MPALPQTVHDLRHQWKPHKVRHDNTLARPLHDWSPKQRVDVIVTNPRTKLKAQLMEALTR